MNRDELIDQSQWLIEKVHGSGPAAAYSMATEFLRTHAGHRSAFVETIEQYRPNREGGYPDAPALNQIGTLDIWLVRRMEEVLESFLNYVQRGLHQGISVERQAQLDVVSDLMEQAFTLVEDPEAHPAIAAVIAGATLEEFLRTWVEGENLSLVNRRPSIDAYAQTLREANKLTKQDIKDITSWAGTRNDAAHGDFAKVSDRSGVRLKLDGINLFMRKYEQPQK